MLPPTNSIAAVTATVVPRCLRFSCSLALRSPQLATAMPSPHGFFARRSHHSRPIAHRNMDYRRSRTSLRRKLRRHLSAHHPPSRLPALTCFAKSQGVSDAHRSRYLATALLRNQQRSVRTDRSFGGYKETPEMAQLDGRGTPGFARRERQPTSMPTACPAPEYEHGRLAGVARRVAGAPVPTQASPCPRHLWLRQMRAC